MTLSLSKLKSATRNHSNAVESLIAETNKPAFAPDERIWKPTKDADGNGSAVIRFLPMMYFHGPDDESSPDFSKVLGVSHKGPGGWYIENSLVTFKEPDPVAEYRAKLYEAGGEANKKLAGKLKPRASFYANVYIVHDTNKENEGKVMILKFGNEIMEKINDAMFPKFSGDPKINPFDLFEGANFRLRVREKDNGMPTYVNSGWDSPKMISDTGGMELDEESLNAVLNQRHDIHEFADRKASFKTYNELKARFETVFKLNQSGGSRMMEEDSPYEAPRQEIDDEIPDFGGDNSSDTDESMEFFKSLASD